jgi:hypothetical protein
MIQLIGIALVLALTLAVTPVAAQQPCVACENLHPVPDTRGTTTAASTVPMVSIDPSTSASVLQTLFEEPVDVEPTGFLATGTRLFGNDIVGID